jgi:SAM-dependent methyltransferase
MVNGERWSYCESKLNRLEYKKSIADAAVDGVVPEGNLRTPAQAQQDIMNWLAASTSASPRGARVIKIPLSGEPSEVARRVAKYGDFTKMNNRWYARRATRRTRASASPEEWAHYHTMYRKLRESGPWSPSKKRSAGSRSAGLVVGDFGCGEALVANPSGRSAPRFIASTTSRSTTTVVACDISKVPLEDGTLDVAIFCLSLMGTNFTDYIREAHRCLRLDGYLHIWEPTSYFDDVGAFCERAREARVRRDGPRVGGRVHPYLCRQEREEA